MATLACWLHADQAVALDCAVLVVSASVAVRIGKSTAATSPRLLQAAVGTRMPSHRPTWFRLRRGPA